MEDPRVLAGMLVGEETEDERLRRMVFVATMAALAATAAGWGIWEGVHYLIRPSAVPTTELWVPWAFAGGCGLCALIGLAWGRARQYLAGPPKN